MQFKNKKSKKVIKKYIKNIWKKIYGCCNGIRELLAKQGCNSVLSNVAIYCWSSNDRYEERFSISC